MDIVVLIYGYVIIKNMHGSTSYYHLVCLFTRSVHHSLTSSFTHSLTHSFMHLLALSLIHSLTHSLTLSFTQAHSLTPLSNLHLLCHTLYDPMIELMLTYCARNLASLLGIEHFCIPVIKRLCMLPILPTIKTTIFTLKSN